VDGGKSDAVGIEVSRPRVKTPKQGKNKKEKPMERKGATLKNKSPEGKADYEAVDVRENGSRNMPGQERTNRQCPAMPESSNGFKKLGKPKRGKGWGKMG